MRQDERRAKTTAALLRQARAAFARSGYDGTSLDSIVRAAGYSKGALYTHFKTKRELFAAVVEDCFAEAEMRTRRVAEAASRGEDPIAAAGQYFDGKEDDEHAGLMAEVWRISSADPDWRLRLDAMRRIRQTMLGQAAIDAGFAPAAALERAQLLSKLIDAEIVGRRFELAAG